MRRRRHITGITWWEEDDPGIPRCTTRGAVEAVKTVK